MSNKCELDEHGNCKTHAPGTAGEAEVVSKIVAATDGALSNAMRQISETGMILAMTSDMVRQRNARAAAKGEPELRNIEAELEELIRPLVAQGVETVRRIRELAGDFSPAPDMTKWDQMVHGVKPGQA